MIHALKVGYLVLATLYCAILFFGGQVLGKGHIKVNGKAVTLSMGWSAFCSAFGHAAFLPITLAVNLWQHTRGAARGGAIDVEVPDNEVLLVEFSEKAIEHVRVMHQRVPFPEVFWHAWEGASVLGEGFAVGVVEVEGIRREYHLLAAFRVTGGVTKMVEDTTRLQAELDRRRGERPAAPTSPP